MADPVSCDQTGKDVQLSILYKIIFVEIAFLIADCDADLKGFRLICVAKEINGRASLRNGANNSFQDVICIKFSIERSPVFVAPKQTAGSSAQKAAP